MGILRFAVRTVFKIGAALAGLAAALWLYSSFMVVEVEGTQMLPLLEPGQKVVASRLNTENLHEGDLIVYKAPYYSTYGEGPYLVRRISAAGEEEVEVTSGEYILQPDTEIIEKDIILGKVIRTWVKENAN